MTQYDYGVIDPDAKSGTALAVDMNQFRDALHSCHSGTSRPAYAVAGLIWTDTSTTPYTVYRFDGVSDNLMGYIDQSAHTWMPVIGGGLNTVASAATTNIGAVKASHVVINGSVNISSFGSSMVPGQIKTVVFGAGLTLIHNGTQMNLPAGGDTVVSAGDRLIVVCTAVNNYTIIAHIRQGADTIEPPGVVKEHAGMDLPAGYLWADGALVARATYAALFNAITRQTTGTTSAGSRIITTVGNNTRVGRNMPISIAGAGAAGALLQTIVTDVGVGTITILTAATTAVVGAAIIVAPWGLGNGTTTFNLPGRAGRKGVGRDDLSGTAANVSQASYSMTTTNGSPTVAVLDGGGAFRTAVNFFISHANIPPGTYITAISADRATLTLSANANASGTAIGRVSPFIDAQTLGSGGGNMSLFPQLHEQYPHTHTITVSNPAHAHSASGADSGHTHSYLTPAFSSGTGSTPNYFYASFASATTGTGYAAITVTVNNATTAITATSSAQTTNVNAQYYAEPAVVMGYIVKT